MNAKTEPGQIDSQVIDNFSLGLPTGVTKHTLVPERFIFIVRIVCTQLDSTGFAYPVLIGRGTRKVKRPFPKADNHNPDLSGAYAKTQ